MLILTNFERFPEKWTSSLGMPGEAVMLKTAWQFLRYSRCADLVIINCDLPLILKLSTLYFLFPFLRRPMLGHDIVLHPPLNLRTRITTHLTRLLLARVDHFSHYFRQWDGYQKYFGIGPDRSSYLPFKPNIRYRAKYRVDSEGEYVLCLGRSERDYDTFVRAIAKLPYPAAIPRPDPGMFHLHGSRLTFKLSELPANLRILEDDGSAESMIRIIERAKLVALPILGGRISASGSGMYLNSMLMGKCVITTVGPGRSDVLKDEALFVPPEDSTALAEAIRRAWEDRDLRLRTAENGRLYAESCGGEAELRQRVLDRALEKLAPQTRCA
jgi:glycosyltransferase involved in cell wall biosynthesis